MLIRLPASSSWNESGLPHDIGKSINPMLVMGQVEGSVYMGLGEILMEEMTYARIATWSTKFRPCWNTKARRPWRCARLRPI